MKVHQQNDQVGQGENLSFTVTLMIIGIVEMTNFHPSMHHVSDLS